MNSLQLPIEILSKREWGALELIARLQNRQIVQALEIEERTVRFHVDNILDKLNVSNRTEAACPAFRKGWIDD